MFDFSIIHEPVASKQRAAIEGVLKRAIQTGSFTYTEVFMSPEPLRTMALEYLDGVSSVNGIPQAVGNPVNVGPVRLVCLEANDTIKISRWGSRNIFGTTIEAPQQKISQNLGNDAMVDDMHPERIARNVLRRSGFPIRGVFSRGANQGSVIEWKWLERRAKEEDAPPEITEIYQSILARTAQNAPAPKIKSADAKAPAHP